LTAEWVLVLVVSLVALELLSVAVAAAVGGMRMRQAMAEMRESLKDLQREAAITLQQVHDTMARAETLVQTLDKTAKEQLDPLACSARATVAHAEAITSALAAGAGAIRRVAGAVESVATPATAAGAVSKLATSPMGRISLVAAIAGIALQTLVLPAVRKKAPPSR